MQKRIGIGANIVNHDNINICVILHEAAIVVGMARLSLSFNGRELGNTQVSLGDVARHRAQCPLFGLCVEYQVVGPVDDVEEDEGGGKELSENFRFPAQDSLQQNLQMLSIRSPVHLDGISNSMSASAMLPPKPKLNAVSTCMGSSNDCPPRPL